MQLIETKSDFNPPSNPEHWITDGENNLQVIDKDGITKVVDEKGGIVKQWKNPDYDRHRELAEKVDSKEPEQTPMIICKSCKGTGKSMRKKRIRRNNKVVKTYAVCKSCNGAKQVIDVFAEPKYKTDSFGNLIKLK